MININTYITEKLHLNKDIKVSKVSHDLKNGDFFFIISLNYWGGDYEVEIYYPFEVISKSNGNLKYKTNADKIVNNDFIINSNNYIEFKFKTQSAVIVNVSTAISILEKIVSEDYKISKEILYDYFDINDVKLLDKFPNTISFGILKVDKILAAFKKIETITEKLHLDKDIKVSSKEDIVDKIVSLLNFEIYEKIINGTIKNLISEWVDEYNVEEIKSYIPLMDKNKFPKEILDNIDEYTTYKKDFINQLKRVGFKNGYKSISRYGDHYINTFYNDMCIYFDADLFDLLIINEF